MSVILLILKIIGILLLCLIGILLLLILLVLFTPVRYIVNGRLHDKRKISGKINWLWPVLSVPFSYEDGAFLYEFRIFGIRWKKKRGTAEDEDFFEEDSGACEANARNGADGEEDRDNGGIKEEDRDYGNAEETAWGCVGAEHSGPDQKTEPQTQGDFKAFPDRPGRSSERSVLDGNKALYPIRNPAAGSSGQALRKKISVSRRKGSPAVRLWKRILTFFQQCKESWRRFLYTVTHFRSKIGDIKKLITEETNKKALGFGFQELKYLLRHFRFRKVEIDLAFSLGDPSYTGQALGVLCLFPVLYRYEVHINPDFESEQMYAKGTFYLKGHMRAVHFAASLFRLWKKKEFRTLVKRVFRKK